LETFILVLMVLLAHGALMILLLTYPKRAALAWWFYLPSLAIAWLAFVLYEFIYIPRHCTGECNIRVDLLLIYPYLAFVSICAIAYFLKRQRIASAE
jgi:hypothetical protein